MSRAATLGRPATALAALWLLSGCAATSVAGAAVGVVGSAAGAAIDVTGSVVGGTVDVVTGGDD
ncbi:MAG: hypothetical protein AAF676_05225 [Pseudomonadota bacterium]